MILIQLCSTQLQIVPSPWGLRQLRLSKLGLFGGVGILMSVQNVCSVWAPGHFSQNLVFSLNVTSVKAARTLNLFRAVPLKDDVGLQGAGDRAQRVTWSPFSWCLASFGVGVVPVRGESPSCSESGWQKAVRSPERL